MEDLVRYLDTIVEPTIEDLRRNRTSVRHAFLACVATFHAIDYLAYDGQPRKGRVGNLRKKFGEENADFKLVDDVAHAFKHVAVGPREEPHLRAHDLMARHPAVFGQMGFGTHAFGDAGRWITLRQNRSVRLLEVIERAVRFLRSKAEPLQGSSAQ